MPTGLRVPSNPLGAFFPGSGQCEFGQCVPSVGFGPSTVALPLPPIADLAELLRLVGRFAGVAGIVGQVIMETGDASPNVVQNRQFKEALRRIASRCGRPLSKDDQRRLHDEITKGGYGLDEIVEIGVGLFCPGN